MFTQKELLSSEPSPRSWISWYSKHYYFGVRVDQREQLLFQKMLETTCGKQSQRLSCPIAEALLPAHHSFTQAVPTPALLLLQLQGLESFLFIRFFPRFESFSYGYHGKEEEWNLSLMKVNTAHYFSCKSSKSQTDFIIKVLTKIKHLSKTINLKLHTIIQT